MLAHSRHGSPHPHDNFSISVREPVGATLRPAGRAGTVPRKPSTLPLRSARDSLSPAGRTPSNPHQPARDLLSCRSAGGGHTPASPAPAPHHLGALRPVGGEAKG